MKTTTWGLTICLLCIASWWMVVDAQGEGCPEPPCDENCFFHGDCVDGECVCDVGWTGENCLDRTCDHCQFGTCVDGTECACHTGYMGEFCDILIGVMPFYRPVCNLENTCSCNDRGTPCPADPPAAVDLTIDQRYLKPYVEWKHFDNCDCAVGDCVGEGLRKLLRFDMMTKNVGNADLFIGSPGDYLGKGLYKWHTCHKHPHFLPWQEFRLINLDNPTQKLVATKSGSTVIDSTRWDRSQPYRRKFTDNVQGLQAGWSDWYPSYLDCQWLDITDLEPGNWMLEVETNPNRVIKELNYNNNRYQLNLTCPRSCGSHGICDFGSYCTCDEGWAGQYCDIEVATTHQCIPNCADKFCGSDGCGGTCHVCERHEVCTRDGECMCRPVCEANECGDDGCGSHCGVCLGEKESCVRGKCVCTPDCAGKACGYDGCKGVCGSCDVLGPRYKCIDYGCHFVGDRNVDNTTFAANVV